MLTDHANLYARGFQARRICALADHSNLYAHGFRARRICMLADFERDNFVCSRISWTPNLYARRFRACQLFGFADLLHLLDQSEAFEKTVFQKALFGITHRIDQSGSIEILQGRVLGSS